MAISLVGSVQTATDAGVTGAISVTLASAAVGDTIVIGLSALATSVTVSSVTCTSESNLTASSAVSSFTGGSGDAGSVGFWVLSNVTTAGSKTVTLNYSSASSSTQIVGWLLRGANTSGAVDVDGTATGSGTAPSVSLSASAANDVAFGICITSFASGDATAAAGFTGVALSNWSGNYEGAYDLDVGASGSIPVGFTTVGNGAWAIKGLLIKAAPVITVTAQPVQQVAASGATATFSVTATAGSGSMLYQWRKNGVDIGGATSSSYTTGTLASSDNLSWFDCVLNDTGASAEVITARAALIVAPSPISGKGLGYGRQWGWFNDVESTRNGRSFALLRKQLAPWNAASSGIQATVFSDWAFDTSANNVSTGLTGSLVTVSAGTLTPVGADVPVGTVRKPGPGVAPFNNNIFQTPPRSTSAPSVVSDTSAALTGSAVTVSAGTLTAAMAVTLNGQAVTASAGTLTPSLSLALTGSAATVSAGTLTPTMALALSGVAATASAGTLTAAESLSLTGELVTVSAGTITANTGSDVSAALTGQAVTVSAGTLGVTADGSAALTGSAVAASAGTLTSAVAVTLNGQDVTASAGTLTAVIAAALSGQAVTVSAGTLGTQVTGDVVAALTGVEVTVSAGILVATGGDAGTQTTGINGGGGGGSIDRRVRRKLDRKLNKILDDVVAEVVYKNLVTEGKATEAAKVVKPFVETKAASVPEPAAVDWDALTRNAKAVGALLQMWRAIERQREIEADDEEWLMF